MASREQSEMSEQMHLQNIVCTDMDKMVCIAEDGQQLPEPVRTVTDEELVDGL